MKRDKKISGQDSHYLDVKRSTVLESTTVTCLQISNTKIYMCSQEKGLRDSSDGFSLCNSGCNTPMEGWTVKPVDFKNVNLAIQEESA